MTPSFFTDPTMEKVVAIRDAASAIVTLIAETFAKAGQSGYQLESGSGWEGAHGSVNQRVRFVLSQHFPIFGLNARNKSIGIKRWHRDHGENVSVIRINDDSGPTTNCSQCFFGDHLNPSINR